MGFLRSLYPFVRDSYERLTAFFIPRYVFLAIYTAEMMIRCLARGFILTKHMYLREPWNWLDFIVVMSA